jgi:hypothetical protein
MVLLDRPPMLTPRHLAVQGILRLTPRPTPETIARELHFSLDEVNRLLDDLGALDRVGAAKGRGHSPREKPPR